MGIMRRRYGLLGDFEPVSEFLRQTYKKDYSNGNLVQPFMEYAHTHPAFHHKLTHRFGLWFDEGELVGLALYEMALGEAYLRVADGYDRLYSEMIAYAESELSVLNAGKHSLSVWTTDRQPDLNGLLAGRGYNRRNSYPITVYEYSKGFLNRSLPEGFSVRSLEDEPDYKKLNAVLWKGFDHGSEPPDDTDSRMLMLSGPHFRKDLTTIIMAPDGEYACYAGMWMDGKNDFAYLEPLATIPEYRRLGLATVALTEAMKKTVQYGAARCVGGNREFYYAIGFETVANNEEWYREWNEAL